MVSRDPDFEGIGLPTSCSKAGAKAISHELDARDAA